MIRNRHDEQLICQKHNLPLEFENPDKSKSNQLYVCNHCIIEQYQLKPIKPIQSIVKQFEQQLDSNSKIWNISIHTLISLREAFTKSIKIIENIIDVIRNQIQQTTNEFQNLNVNQQEGIKQAHKNYLQTQLNHQRNIIQQIEQLKQNSSIDKLIQGLNEINLQQLNQDDYKQKIKIVEIQKKSNQDQIVPLNFGQQLKVKRYEYQLMPQLSTKQEKDCYALAFNYDGSVIVAGCEEIIQVFEFKNNQLKKVQSLKSHTEIVVCLKFMNKSYQFISGSLDNTIKIWAGNNKNQYIILQTLTEHNNFIRCLIINSNDDLIVSGSQDESINFWGLNGNKWQLDQQIICSSKALSFNDSNTKLISFDDDKSIQVFEQYGNQWIISQQIQVENDGARLCFISDDQFVFFPWKKQLHFYILNSQTNQFEQQMKIRVRIGKYDDFGFPIKFIRSKNLLIVKSCEFVHVFRKQGEGNFIQDQLINFEEFCFYGDVSEDGNFLVTWDQSSKLCQVRYLKEIL